MENETIDLSMLGGEAAFNPYLFDRDPVWMILPLLMIAFTLLHLKKIKKISQPSKSAAPKKEE